ncbi:MAG TPA: hypothetical protein VHG52_04780 [Thermomicrobiales bacterium]|nr:hypothetical protein [Thermomicrobiales bacterium]
MNYYGFDHAVRGPGEKGVGAVLAAMTLLAVVVMVGWSALIVVVNAAEVESSRHPAEQEKDVRSLSEQYKVKEWKPGDPVRVVPDLREDANSAEGGEHNKTEASAPMVHDRVAPQVREGSVEDLTTAEEYQEGDPVRVAPDLREEESNE